jgi:hypothetical protein
MRPPQLRFALLGISVQHIPCFAAPENAKPFCRMVMARRFTLG